jgi:hypothetical protein
MKTVEPRPLSENDRMQWGAVKKMSCTKPPGTVFRAWRDCGTGLCPMKSLHTPIPRHHCICAIDMKMDSLNPQDNNSPLEGSTDVRFRHIDHCKRFYPLGGSAASRLDHMQQTVMVDNSPVVRLAIFIEQQLIGSKI